MIDCEGQSVLKCFLQTVQHVSYCRLLYIKKYCEVITINILITSGHTTEKIDNIRNISNVSTGSLGDKIAKKYLEMGHIVYYICNINSKQPKSDNAKVTYITDVASAVLVIKDLLKNIDIDIIVHAMAVSDFTVKHVFDFDNFEQNLKYEINAHKLLNKLSLDTNQKISSNIQNLGIMLTQTPKIVSILRNLAENAVIVSFKLQDNVSNDELISRAMQLLIKNKCDFVLANDIKNINGEEHIGYLLRPDKSFIQYNTKEEIAAAIVCESIKQKEG